MAHKPYETLRSEEVARQRQAAETARERAIAGRAKDSRTVSNAEALRDCLKSDALSLQRDGYRMETNSGRDPNQGFVVYVALRAWDDRREPDKHTGEHRLVPAASLQVKDDTFRDPGYGARFITNDVQVAAQYLLAQVARRGPCRKGSWWERLRHRLAL